MPDFQFVEEAADGGVRPDHCSTLQQDEAETDVGCGGRCRPCMPRMTCAGDRDCARAVCASGVCVAVVCLEGKGDCDGDLSNGCETNLKTSAEHCGACEAPCN